MPKNSINICMRYIEPSTKNTRRLIMDAGFINDRENLALILDVHIRTLQRWIVKDSAPTSVKLFLRSLVADLGVFNSAWAGFRVWEDEIWTPEDYRITPGMMRAIPYWRSMSQCKRYGLGENVVALISPNARFITGDDHPALLTE